MCQQPAAVHSSVYCGSCNRRAGTAHSQQGFLHQESYLLYYYFDFEVVIGTIPLLLLQYSSTAVVEST